MNYESPYLTKNLTHNKIMDHLAQFKGGKSPEHKESFKDLIEVYNNALKAIAQLEVCGNAFIDTNTGKVIDLSAI